MNRTLLRIVIAVLAIATALIHFSLLLGGFDIPFLLNGLGYLALLVALFWNAPIVANRRQLVHVVFIAYTAVTIIAWIAVGDRGIVGWVDKAIEVLLILALFQHWRTAPVEKVTA